MKNDTRTITVTPKNRSIILRHLDKKPCPLSGKNKAQRERLKSGFDAVWNNKAGGNRVRFLTK